MSYWLLNLLWAVVGGVIGSVIALLFGARLEPRFEITTADDVNDDVSYSPNHPSPRSKYFRVKVVNRPVGKAFGWIARRQIAQQVSARITFVELKRTMKGRWASTLELPAATRSDWIRLALFPEPVTIAAGESEILDVLVKHQGDQEAFGWNNEAYLFEWRPPHNRLPPGGYRVEVEILSVNASNQRRAFKTHVGATIETTSLERA